MNKKDYLLKQEKRGTRSALILMLTFLTFTAALIVAGFWLVKFWPNGGSGWQIWFLVVLVWLMGGYYLLLPFLVSKKFGQKFNQGRLGEDVVANLLSGLGAGYHAFHDVHFGRGGNIDFVITGPCGVVVLEVKNYRVAAEVRGGKLYLAGKQTRGKEIYQAMRSAMLLKEFLETKVITRVYVTAVLVFASPAVLPSGFTKVGSVWLTNQAGLLQILNKLPPYANMEEIDKISRVLTLISRRKII